MPLKLQSELVKVPDSHLWFVGACSNRMVSVPSGLDAIASLRKFEMLYEFYITLNLLFHSASLSLVLYSAFSSEPVR